MKYIIFLLLFVVTQLKAQTQSVSTGKETPLTDKEIQFAQQGYNEMMQSQNYKELREMSSAVAVKLNNIPYPKGMELLDRQDVTKWLTEILDKTKFTTVEEGVGTIYEYAEKSKQVSIEYAELYKLLRRAALTGQIKEIMDSYINTKQE